MKRRTKTNLYSIANLILKLFCILLLHLDYKQNPKYIIIL